VTRFQSSRYVGRISRLGAGRLTRSSDLRLDELLFIQGDQGTPPSPPQMAETRLRAASGHEQGKRVLCVGGGRQIPPCQPSANLGLVREGHADPACDRRGGQEMMRLRRASASCRPIVGRALVIDHVSQRLVSPNALQRIYDETGARGARAERSTVFRTEPGRRRIAAATASATTAAPAGVK